MSMYLKQGLLLGVCIFSSSLLFAQVREYHLNIAESTVNLTGKEIKKITVNGQFPAPKLEFEEGDEAVIHVRNLLKNQDSSIHWHGLLLPGLMDGVPGFNGFQGIQPNQDFVYRFKVRQNGTYWYHAHSKGQEQDGLYGALVIYPKGKKPLAEYEKIERDYVVMLSDFHESSSQQIMNNLKKSAEYYQNQRETVADVFKQIKQQGLKSTWQDRRMWNQMRMLKTDLSDVTGYTFLMNGKTPQQNWRGVFKPNEKVRLRFINASAMSFYDVAIPHLKMTVVSADGQAVKPVAVDEFRIGAAETYDVIVEPKADHYQIEAESIDRSGFAIGTLQNEQSKMMHDIHMPQHRPRALLAMQDMGHGQHVELDHLSKNHSEMSHSQRSHSEMSHAEMNHASQDYSSKENDSTQLKVQVNQVEKNSEHHQHVQTENHDQQVSLNNEMNHNEMTHSQMSHDIMRHDGLKHKEVDQLAHRHSDPIKTEPTIQKVQGWANAATPSTHKALQYSDLKSLTIQKDTRPAERELVIRLGGTMERYIWTINGKKFSDAEPLKVQYGERIRLKFVNESMMAHPMHLHGMFMQLENGQTNLELPNKHTVVVPPGQTVTTLLTADELGEWAIHCHLLYHMTAGMMSKLVVAKVADQSEHTSSQGVQSSPQVNLVEGDQHAHH